MDWNRFVRERWKTILGVFLITIGLDALINNQIIYSNLPPQLAETFQFYYKETPTKTLPSILMNLINWPFYTVMLIGGIFIGWDLMYFRKKSNEVVKYDY
ncbi:hypothetical protein HZB88_05375 [archaeon]|nr:hypothetical protein [archaeon]